MAPAPASPEGGAPLRAPGLAGGQPPVLLPLLLARADGRQPPATTTTMGNDESPSNRYHWKEFKVKTIRFCPKNYFAFFY